MTFHINEQGEKSREQIIDILQDMQSNVPDRVAESNRASVDVGLGVVEAKNLTVRHW